MDQFDGECARIHGLMAVISCVMSLRSMVFARMALKLRECKISLTGTSLSAKQA